MSYICRSACGNCPVFVGSSSALQKESIAHFLAFLADCLGGWPKFESSKRQILSFRVISSCQSLQYTLNKCFPAFLSLQSCSCHVPNRNTHGHKIGRL